MISAVITFINLMDVRLTARAQVIFVTGVCASFAFIILVAFYHVASGRPHSEGARGGGGCLDVIIRWFTKVGPDVNLKQLQIINLLKGIYKYSIFF